MINLKEVNFGLNKYCGPAVLSALTGESTDRCAAVISAVSGEKEIKAVERAHLKEALKRLRFNVEKTIFSGSTLYGTLHRMHTYDGLYVVFVPHHVVAIEIKNTKIYICDNHCRTPLDIKQSARLSQKVEEVIQVFPKATPKFVNAKIRIIKNINNLEVWSYNNYESKEDDTRYLLGSIRFKDDLEFRQIIFALNEVYGEYK